MTTTAEPYTRLLRPRMKLECGIWITPLMLNRTALSEGLAPISLRMGTRPECMGAALSAQ